MTGCERCSGEHDSRRCTAHVKLEGGGLRPCRKYPLKGAAVCRSHGGGAGQVRLAAARRTALAEEVARNPRRHPAVVLLDAIHLADTLAQRVLESGGDPEEALSATMRAAALAKTALDVNLAEREVRRHESIVRRDGEDVMFLLQETLRRLGRQWEEPAVKAAVRESLAALETRRAG
jgi:hypothetical protein